MAKTFTPRLDILPPAQLRLWEEIACLPRRFVLYGGTALALRLGHRQSEDFDFFLDTGFDPRSLFESLPLLNGGTILQSEPNTLTCLVDRNGSVRVSFLGVPKLVRLRAPSAALGSGTLVAHLLDLAGTKAAVVQVRAQQKDYIDIHALMTLGDIDLATQIAAAKAIYGAAFAPTESLKALTYFEDGDLQSLPHEIRERLVIAAASIDPLNLPRVRASGQRKLKQPNS